MRSMLSTTAILRRGVTLLALASAETAFAADSDANAAERAGDSRERMICKRFVETGSLVRGYRTCKTKKEWEWERDNIRAAPFASGSCSSAEGGVCGKIGG